MTEENKGLKATGEVEAKSTKNTGISYKVGDNWYFVNASKDIPEFERGDVVEVDYDLGTPSRDGGTPPRWVNNVVKKNGEAKVEYENKTTQQVVEGKSKEVDKPDVKTILTPILADWQACYNGVEGVLGHKPQTDGELAGVNSCFIQLNKAKSYR